MKKFVQTLFALMILSAPLAAEDLDLKGALGPRGEPTRDIEGLLVRKDLKLGFVDIQAPQDQHTIYRVKLEGVDKPIITKITQSHLGNLIALKNIHWNSVDHVGDETTKSIASNCLEQKITFEEIKNLGSKATDLNSFLQSIPKASLQKFTMAYKSPNPQGPHTPTEGFRCPRIIRFSADAKVILAYRACGAKEETVDAIYFDDLKKEPLFAQLIFEKNGTKVSRWASPAELKSCLLCHQSASGRTMPGWIWQSYDKWDGFFGSHDDIVDPTKAEGEPQLILRERQWLAYHKKSSLPALSTLPWSTAKDDYPYLSVPKLMNYNYRPNAHLTVALSRLKAQQIAMKLYQNPSFKKIESLVLQESLGCKERSHIISQIDSALGLTEKALSLEEQFLRSTYEPRTFSTGVNIQKISFALGMNSADWDLDIDPDRMGQFNTAELSISEYVIGALIKLHLKEKPELLKQLNFYSPFTSFFGEKFSCLNDDNGAEDFNPAQRQRLCNILKSEGSSGISGAPKKVVPSKDILNEDPSEFVTHGSISKCVGCHEKGSVAPIPFRNSRLLRESLNKPSKFYPQRTLRQEIERRVKVGDMPLGMFLAPEMRQSLIEFLDLTLKGD